MCMKILIVEDDLEVVVYFLKVFCEMGIVVDYVSDGESGFFMVLENVYDVLVVDCMLLCCDGILLIMEL